MSVTPVILLVHGAWHTPAHYDMLIQALIAMEYRVVAPQLPSSGPLHTRAEYKVNDDVLHLESILDDLLADNCDVFILTHSYGGIPAQKAAASRGWTSSKSTTKGKIVGIGMIASFLLPPSAGLWRSEEDRPPWAIVSREYSAVIVGPPGGVSLFYQDVDPDQAQQAVKGLQAQALLSFEQSGGGESAGWTEGIPTTYLVCEDDAAVPVVFQRGMIEAANGQLDSSDTPGPNIILVESIAGGHSPFAKPQTVPKVVEFVTSSIKWVSNACSGLSEEA